MCMQLYRGFDEEMRAVVATNLEGRGIKCHPETNLAKVSSLTFTAEL